MSPIGADQAMAIRTAASELSELENLADTSSLREIFYDLTEAMRDLREPLKTLLAAADEVNGETNHDSVLALSHLQNLAALLSERANNL